MERFYFTFGTVGHPYVGGWTVVDAPNRDLACDAFRLHHKDKVTGMIHCSGIYSQKEFSRTRMEDEGNYGCRAQEYIKVNVELTNHI